MVCVHPSDDVLRAFSVAEPAIKIFVGRTGPNSRIRKTGSGKRDSENGIRKNAIWKKTGFGKRD